jgi:cobalamin biosynthesis Mg chelatase CobN
MDQPHRAILPVNAARVFTVCDVKSELLRVDARSGRSVAAQLSEGEAMRGQHHAGTKTSGRSTSAVVGVIVVTLLILLVIVIILAVG